jgi:hypothetical protein
VQFVLWYLSVLHHMCYKLLVLSVEIMSYDSQFLNHTIFL